MIDTSRKNDQSVCERLQRINGRFMNELDLQGRYRWQVQHQQCQHRQSQRHQSVQHQHVHLLLAEKLVPLVVELELELALELKRMTRVDRSKG